MNRRGFLKSVLAAGVAPAFVGSSVLMPVKSLWTPPMAVGEWGRYEGFSFIQSGTGAYRPLLFRIMYEQEAGGAIYSQDFYPPLEIPPGDTVHVTRLPSGARILRIEQTF